MATRDGETIRASAWAEARRKVRDDEGSVLYGVTGQVTLLAQSQLKLIREIDRGTQLSDSRGTANLHEIDFVLTSLSFRRTESGCHLNLWAVLFQARRRLHSLDHLHGAKKPGRLQRGVRLIELRRSEGISLGGVWLAIANDAIRPAIRYPYFDGIDAGA